MVRGGILLKWGNCISISWDSCNHDGVVESFDSPVGCVDSHGFNNGLEETKEKQKEARSGASAL